MSETIAEHEAAKRDGHRELDHDHRAILPAASDTHRQHGRKRIRQPQPVRALP
ncbi:hypothetical protein QCN29_18130 [Streptomyces sp. HNM0663]|uniref:Uncharacterized protein n=1 Tax=Streptomyces chengmaiensis TaxID=3040919 RepID=A0ABT6HPL9_9ACTN|nr:hypothetical protein [Streptomyces chengmaiensis]MDH2390671.1 hypothetical protein [Streptomyces chengmaiensis]